MPTKLQDQEMGKVLPWQQLSPDIASKQSHTRYHAIKPPDQI